MKKILSIVIGVFLGTTIAFSQGTVTFNAYALGEGISEATDATTYGGGTITITAKSAKAKTNFLGGFSSWSYTQAFTATGISIEGRTATEGYHKGWATGTVNTSGPQVKLEASPSAGYYFAGFTEQNSLNPTSWVAQSTPYGDFTLDYVGSNYEKKYYAIFNYIVSLPKPNNVSIKLVGGESEPKKVQLPKVVNTTELVLTITGDVEQSGWFQLSKDNANFANSISFASSASELSADGSVTNLTFHVKFTGTMEDATNYIEDNVKVTITAPNEAPDLSWEIPIKISAEYDTYQFLKPQILGISDYTGIDFGSYTAQLADADNTSRTITNTDPDPIQLKSDGHYSVTLTANPSASYKFYGWYKITFNEDGTEKDPVLVSRSNPYGPVNFNESAKIYPLYLPKEQALFVIKEDNSQTPYYDLQEALNIANTTNGYSTVVFNAPTKGTTGTLSPRKNADGTIIPYEVPAGVTLLIPGDAAYTSRTRYSELNSSDYLVRPKDFVPDYYSKLTMSAGTEIKLNEGCLSVYATSSKSQCYNGMPMTYGWLEMGTNCKISTTETKESYVCALGYITGIDNTSSVIINEGSIVYESFQLNDFRGGSALAPLLGAGMLNNDKRVFPVQQYYVQNIEVPMTIKWGATLKVVTAVEVRDNFFVSEAVLFAEKSGMIHMISNVDIVKSYDAVNDKQRYELKGTGDKANSYAEFGSIYLDLGTMLGISLTMDTKDYVLPITNNMELIFDNVTVNMPAEITHGVGLLAGAKAWIKQNAQLDINSPIYVYDKDQNKLIIEGEPGNGYFYASNTELMPINYTPNNSHKDGSIYKRRPDNLTSAELKIDGVVNVNKDGLYTTISGADIISSQSGAQVLINVKHSKTSDQTLYQAKQSGSGTDTKVNYYPININPFWLKNSDGSYVETAGAANGTTYTYYATAYDSNGNVTAGVWSLPPAKVTADSWNGTNVTATMPNQVYPMTITCLVENVTADNFKTAFTGSLDGTGFAFAGTDSKFENSISLTDNILSIAVNYTPQNNTSIQHTATLTLINATVPTADYTFSTELSASEEYIPDFSLSRTDNTNYINLPTVEIGETSSVEGNAAFSIVPTSGNVTTLSDDSRLKWSYTIKNGDGTPNNEFTYTQGALSNGVIGGNKVTYTPTSDEDKSVILTITATYTPTTGEAQSHSENITLNGTSLTVNNLAFNMPEHIWVTDKNIPVKFNEGHNNTNTITVELTSNGTDELPAVELIKNDDGTYYINALNAGTFALRATQDATTEIGSANIATEPIEVKKLTPEPKWNWGVVYGNQTYSIPFDPETVVDGKWTLVESSDPTNALAYDEAAHTIQVMNVGETTSAQFTFTQEETDIYEPLEQQPIVAINPDPRILTLVLNNKAKYDIVVAGEHSDGVVCNDYGMITLPANGYVIVQFVGIPGDLTFQISEGAEYASISVAENIDKANAESWQEITKSALEDKWAFTNANSSYVKLTNSSANAITLTNLTITENSSYKRNSYYAKAEAIVYPKGAGSVAAKGSYTAGGEYANVFNEFSDFTETTFAYSTAAEEFIEMTPNLRFYLRAQSSAGYYFTTWIPVGSPMITSDKLSWDDSSNKYELRLATLASDKSIAYSFDTYINLFCQQNQEICSEAKPESGEPNSDAVAYMNAGALALIPATNVGTWQANFALAQVVSAEDAVWDEVTSPNESVEHAVVFNILGDDTNDFVASIEEGNGFTFTEDDITLSVVNNTYTIKVAYTPQDVHGTHTANLTLARADVDGQPAQSKTAKLTVEENLTPSFQLSNTDFGSGTLGQETIIDILPTDKNTVAQLLNPSKLHWEASLSTGTPFEIISVADDGTCRVRYFRTESGDKSATLTLTATYIDSKGTEIRCSKTCTLSGSSTTEKAVNTLALKQDLVLYVDDEAVSPFSVIDENNTALITITLPTECTALVVENNKIKPSGDFTTGTFVIEVSQAASEYIQGAGPLTATVVVKKHTPEVTWNWSTLYFGQTYDTPITTNSTGSLTISALDDKNIVLYDDNTKTLSVEPLTEGEYEVDFSVEIAESNIYERYEATHSATIYKDPRHLRVDVNEALTYRSVTIADKTGENVSFADGGIHFADVAGSEYESRQWTMYFIGVPDQLFFTPSGNNAWEIRESSDGTNWNPAFASSQLPAGKPFSMSLLPSTRYLRISYAKTADDVAERSNGELNSFYITALEGVKANVDGLYMPIAADATINPTTKQVILHYTSQEDLTISTSDPLFTVDVNTLPKVEVDTYGVDTIAVTSKATNEKEGRIYVKNKAGDILLELPIYSFIFPQSLPIQLATDDPQRFYYVTTATNNVAWDKDERIINFQNAQSNTPRSVTFAFDGAPTLMRFNHTAGERGTWTIRESANNADDWYDANAETRVADGDEIEQGLLSTTRYVQLTYTSAYSERVDVSNLIIVGDASVTTDVTVLELTDVEPTKNLTVTAFNLAAFKVSVDNTNFTVGTIDKSGLGASVAEVLVPITWKATAAVEYATLTITNPNDNDAVLATVELVGTKQSISDPTNIGIYTGLAENITKLNGTFEGTTRRPVDLSNAFDEETRSKALFDYLFIYGETSTMDGSATIVTPNSQHGSNAKTPCYIYKRDGDSYNLYKVVDNVNSEDKAWPGYIPVEANGISTRVYITGFAPYASTGYTKEEEGVWLFRGRAGSKLDIYLEDCYIYSRYKTVDGHSFIDRDNGESFAEQYARGSGGVLVFECSDVNNAANPFKVTIHTMDSSLLKSHYGCFLSSIVGRAFQVSSPVQIHLISTDITATTHLSFDDKWPKAITRTLTDGVVTDENVEETKRTNGFLSLQKQVNNAPSIDLGSPNTVVNFNGGQVELQNAQNVSDNYKTTLAISYRGGKFAGYFLAHGVGTDEVSGTVNFNDGTTTVIPMTVDERYRQYYLMDEDANGNELATTSTLRCPEHTYVYGGSHCMMRACNEPTSKGGAPLSHDGADAVRLGLYKYPSASYTTGEGNDAVTHAGGWDLIPGANGLVQIPEKYIPNIEVGDKVARKYNVESVMPNDNGTPDNPADDYLNFWVPAGYDDSVTPEVDLKISYWKAAMTRIKAEYASYGGSVGGDVKIGDDSDVETELVYNFLYCALDNDIKDVISKKEVINGQEVHSYAAPVKHPAAQGYLEIRPSYVSDSAVHYVKNLKPYKVQNRVYYITPIPSADNWMTFTAPFDVENLYVVETYDEKALSTLGVKSEIKIAQARHNADFAAFFGVALALGSDRDFDDIYANYMGWARLQDVGKYEGTYNLRGKHAMEYYDGTNWSTANYYLYENQGTWTVNADGAFDTQWTLPNTEDNILMNKGNTYSLLFPFCTGCWEYDEDGNLSEERTMWDYWSGKFIIFESTLRSEENPHVIDGLNDAKVDIANVVPQTGEAHIMGNTSFGELKLTNEHLYAYNSVNPMLENFEYAENRERTILPTNAFMLANIPNNPVTEMPARRILRTGEIIYEKDNISSDNQQGGIPTVGGGNDLFITSTEEGINIAVAEPQHVRVVSSTGWVIFSGMVSQSVDVPLSTTGIYIVSGENEVHKIVY